MCSGAFSIDFEGIFVSFGTERRSKVAQYWAFEHLGNEWALQLDKNQFPTFCPSVPSVNGPFGTTKAQNQLPFPWDIWLRKSLLFCTSGQQCLWPGKKALGHFGFGLFSSTKPFEFLDLLVFKTKKYQDQKSQNREISIRKVYKPKSLKTNY